MLHRGGGGGGDNSQITSCASLPGRRVLLSGRLLPLFFSQCLCVSLILSLPRLQLLLHTVHVFLRGAKQNYYRKYNKQIADISTQMSPPACTCRYYLISTIVQSQSTISIIYILFRLGAATKASRNRPFSADVTSCSLINQQCWIARIFSQNVLYEVLRRYLKFDYNSLLCELHTIEFHPFPRKSRQSNIVD